MHRLTYFCIALAALWGAQAPAQPATEARTFRVDMARSDIHWQIYKAGAFARFGHNHVISVGAGQGSVTLAPELADSRFELTVPVNGLVVDDPELRSGKGEDFASEPTDEDIAGTKTNMLSETVLDGERFPVVRVTATNLTALDADATLDLTFELLGRSVTHTVPAHVTLVGDELTATGQFSLQHEDLGMEPFSVMMGALQVGPQIDFLYHVHAVAVEGD